MKTKALLLSLAAFGLSSCDTATDDGRDVAEAVDEVPQGPVGKADGADFPVPEPRYHSFSEVEDYLFDVAGTFDDVATLGVYGESPQGRPLYALLIEENPSFEDDPIKPNILLNFSIHGDEIITVESAMAVIHRLVTGHGVDPRVTALTENLEIVVVPVVSPDGFAARSRTVQGVNPNRQFPHPADPNRVGISVIEDAKALYGFYRFVGVLDYHAFGELVMLPWGGSFDRSPRFDELAEIGIDLAQGVDYTPGQLSFLFGQTAQGGSADWYHREGALAIGIELGQSKAPPPAQIPVVTADATEIALRYLEHF